MALSAAVVTEFRHGEHFTADVAGAVSGLDVSVAQGGGVELAVAEMAVELLVAVDVVVAETSSTGKGDDRVRAVSAAEVARGGLVMMVAFRVVGEGLAACSAPDRTRLLLLLLLSLLFVYDVVVEEVGDIFKSFVTCATLEYKRCYRYSIVRFHLLSRALTTGGEHCLAESILFGTCGCSRFLFTSGLFGIRAFGNVICVFSLSLEFFVWRNWDRGFVEDLRSTGFRIG